MRLAGRTRTLEAAIAELAPGGDGVAICEVDGERRAVFVPGVVPGERVRMEVDLSRRPARGRLLAVLEPGAGRAVSKPCAHLGRCGGCDWMHLIPGVQANEHARIVGRLLGHPFAEIRVHPAARTEGYRGRARVHAVARGRTILVGMFARRSREPAVVDACVVLDPALDRARSALASWLEGARGRGEAHLSLGLPAAEGKRKAVIDLRWQGELPGAVFGRFERAVATGELAGARLWSGDVRVPATIGDPTPFIEGADGEPLRLAAGGFSQATEAGNTGLVRRVAELASEVDPGPAVELYCGAGNLTVLLARDREVVAVEQDRDACAAARVNLASRGLAARVRVVEGDASSFPIPKATALVVLDPPREGARPVADQLAAHWTKRRAPAIVYVACDPPTLARDVGILRGAGWQLRSVDTFEMFPHTSHVETVVSLVPA